MFKAIKEFFLGKPAVLPTPEVEAPAPYKLETPFIVPAAPVVEATPAPAKVEAAPVKKAPVKRSSPPAAKKPAVRKPKAAS